MKKSQRRIRKSHSSTPNRKPSGSTARTTPATPRGTRSTNKQVRVVLQIADPDRRGELAARQSLAAAVWRHGRGPWLGCRGDCPGVRPPAGWVDNRWDPGEIADDLLTEADAAPGHGKSFWETPSERLSICRVGRKLEIRFDGDHLALWNREYYAGARLWLVAEALGGKRPVDFKLVSGSVGKAGQPERWLRTNVR